MSCLDGGEFILVFNDFKTISQLLGLLIINTFYHFHFIYCCTPVGKSCSHLCRSIRNRDLLVFMTFVNVLYFYGLFIGNYAKYYDYHGSVQIVM
jgi:hypothetical protein